MSLKEGSQREDSKSERENGTDREDVLDRDAPQTLVDHGDRGAAPPSPFLARITDDISFTRCRRLLRPVLHSLSVRLVRFITEIDNSL